MENEKKTGAPAPAGEHQQNHKRNRPPRRKGYFIDPANPQKEGVSAPVAQKPKEAENPQKKNGEAPAPAGENGQRREGGQNQRKRHKKHRSGNHQTPKEAPELLEATSSEKAAEAPQKPQGGQRNDRRPQNDRGGQQKNRSADRLIHQKEEKKPLPLPSDDEYEEVHFPPEEAAPAPASEEAAEEEVARVEVVGIRFKNSGKVYYFAPGKLTLKRGDAAIVETARGQEFGEVALGNTMVKESDTVPPLRPILRAATDADRVHHADNKKKEEESFRICNAKIAAHGLDMKLIDAQYTFDNSKLLFYFTSAGRVDFRDLVKDLASVFRTRIELRQIGIRDEAKLMGGIGMCGRPLCCTRFLSDFGQVSIKMAKEQNLSLNSAKISGICGRLMCCLRYEHEAYEYEIKRTPPVDSTVRTADGNGTVTEINPLVGTIKVRLFSSPETPPKTYRRDDVIMLRKKNDKSEKADKNEKKK